MTLDELIAKLHEIREEDTTDDPEVFIVRDERTPLLIVEVDEDAAKNAIIILA